MASGIYRGIVRGGLVVLLEQETPLNDGTEVVVTPVAAPGTGAAILAALEASPHVPTAWVDELEQMIAAGQRPSSTENPFAEDRCNGEGH